MVECNICYHRCNLGTNEYGKCKVRHNDGEKITLGKWYGQSSALAVDSIEKRPFFHFFPGEKFLSIGFFGCSFWCKSCINNKVTQELKVEDWFASNHVSPQQLFQIAVDKKAKGVVFSYNEPIVHFEYLEDFVDISSASNLKLAMKTNGFMTDYSLNGVIRCFDAFNVDIKANSDSYEEFCGGNLEIIQKNIEQIANSDKWLEISYLILPSLVTNYDWHIEFSKWLSSLSKNIPVHLLYFYPYGKIREEYPLEYLIDIRSIMSRELNYVYISNTYDESMIKYKSTYCPLCGKLRISRNGNIEFVLCDCGIDIAGVFE